MRGDRVHVQDLPSPRILVGARLPMRYRFGLKTADFLVCRTCGTYIAAVLTTSRGAFATVNINAMQDAVDVREAEPMSYEGEAHTERLRRRERNWTPVA